MNFMDFITAEHLVVVVALVGLGKIFKTVDDAWVANKYIPLVLLVLAVMYSLFTTGMTADSVVKGVILAAAAVFSHQTVKQLL